MRMAEHVPSWCVCSLVFEQIGTTDENNWTWIQGVSLLSSIWADKDPWQEMHPASETSLQHLRKSESLTRNV